MNNIQTYNEYLNESVYHDFMMRKLKNDDAQAIAFFFSIGALGQLFNLMSMDM